MSWDSLLRHRCRLALLPMLVLSALSWPARAAEPGMLFLMQDYPPFVVNDNGHASGPYPDIVRRACSLLARDCTLKFVPWRRAQWDVEHGQADGLFVVLRTPDREALYYFSPPLLSSAFGFFVRDGSPLKYAEPQDAAGWTVGVFGPSGSSRMASGLADTIVPRPQINFEIDNLTALKKLQAGRYGAHGAAFMNVELGRALIAKHQLQGVRLAGELPPAAHHVGLSRLKLSPAEAERFHAALRELIDNGTVAQIARAYGLKVAPQAK
jgi:polar amino acid transport system substrate-binding protein